MLHSIFSINNYVNLEYVNFNTYIPVLAVHELHGSDGCSEETANDQIFLYCKRSSYTGIINSTR